MLETITGPVSLFLGSTVALYIFTQPRKDDGELDEKTISFKGAMKYSPAAMRLRSLVDEMDM